MNNNELYAIRTWKRDGGRNRMLLNDAVLNLVYNAGDKKGNREKLRKALLEGEIVSTPLAEFQLDWSSYEAVQRDRVGVCV